MLGDERLARFYALVEHLGGLRHVLERGGAILDQRHRFGEAPRVGFIDVLVVGVTNGGLSPIRSPEFHGPRRIQPPTRP